jgi:L-seryl-tRNA(Ser) seleniumtransferase
MGRLADQPGVVARVVPDPTGNPLERIAVDVDPNYAFITAWELADRLAAGDPPIIVRDHEAEHNYFFLDPCNLHPGEAEIVAARILEELALARARRQTSAYSAAERKARRFARLLRWPDSD